MKNNNAGDLDVLNVELKEHIVNDLKRSVETSTLGISSYPQNDWDFDVDQFSKIPNKFIFIAKQDKIVSTYHTDYYLKNVKEMNKIEYDVDHFGIMRQFEEIISHVV